MDIGAENEENEYEDDDDDDDEDDEEEEDDDDDDNELPNEEDEEENEHEIVIPKGWKTGVSKCKRKYFYNEYNKDKWYLNYDTNGKHYFYNAENRSVWELPGLVQQTSGEKRDEAEKEKGFRQNFDEDLPTFKNLFNRLSMRHTDGNQSMVHNEETSGAVASIFPKLPVNTSSSFEQVIVVYLFMNSNQLEYLIE